MTMLRAAAVQFQHAPGDKAANLATIERFVASAAEKQVELIAFSECCISGYWHLRHLDRDQMLSLAEPVPAGPATQTLLQLARRYNISLGAGLIERDADDRMFNSYVVAMPDGRFVCHRKLHVFVNPFLSAGDSYTVATLPSGVRIGVLICYDNNLIENARATALLGAEVLLAPHQTGGCKSGSPFAMGVIDRELWERRETDPTAINAEIRGDKGRGWLLRWLPARAHDNGLFVLFANGVGPDDNEVRTGNAMLIDCYGRIVSETDRAGDDMVVADLDLTLRERCTGVRWIKARRPELYQPLVIPTGQEQETRAVRFQYDDDPTNRR
ncbi:MAG TPA: nitrilase family protein [Pirellulaceae bacterium]|nr:nitrilase family protein [Pirellulaceae bacterium]